MKTFRARILVAVGIVAIAAIALLLRSAKKTDSKTEEPQTPITKQEIVPDTPPAQTNVAIPPQNALNVIRAAEMTDAEKAELAKKFSERFKPAMETWFSAYEGRIPFKLEDVTLDKFVERIGKNPSFYLYTFVFDGITFTIQDSNDKTKVFYLMVKKAAQDMNRIPDKGTVPDFNMPVTREEAVRMVKADAGIEIKPNEIIIRSTAASSALNGGATVHFMPSGLDPNNALNYKIDLVFGADGKLVNYERDPFF